MNRTLERRLGAAEGAAGIRRKPRHDARQAKALDDWFEAVTGKRIAEISCNELDRLERLFRSCADSDEPMGDDAADLVRGCMDERQRVIDLDRVRRRLDQGPAW